MRTAGGGAAPAAGIRDAVPPFPWNSSGAQASRQMPRKETSVTIVVPTTHFKNLIFYIVQLEASSRISPLKARSAPLNISELSLLKVFGSLASLLPHCRTELCTGTVGSAYGDRIN